MAATAAGVLGCLAANFATDRCTIDPSASLLRIGTFIGTKCPDFRANARSHLFGLAGTACPSGKRA